MKLLKWLFGSKKRALNKPAVSGRSEQLCGNLDENYNCKNMCLTHCIDGNKFYK